MSENTKIEWCDHTFNPWIGCTKVGPGCDNCYAEADFDKRRHVVRWGAGQPRKRTSEANWAKPLTWNRNHDKFFFKRHGRRQRVFCSSLADVFDNAVSREWRADLATLILNTPNLDWLLLTKRIGNAEAMLADMFPDGLPDNVWLGATICNQEEADRDIQKLLATPARVHFLSMEPLLGPVSFRWASWVDRPRMHREHGCENHLDGLRGIDWVIVGGESGPNARPMNPEWARSLRDQCASSGVPFLFKQWGEWTRANMQPAETSGRYALAPRKHEGSIIEIDHYPRQFNAFGSTILERVGKKAAGRLLDGRAWDEFPQGAA